MHPIFVYACSVELLPFALLYVFPFKIVERNVQFANVQPTANQGLQYGRSPIEMHQIKRFISFGSHGYGRYKYFRNGKEIKPPFWRNKRIVTLTAIGSVGTAAWIYGHIDEVPITKRKRFVSVSPKVEAWMTQNVYQQLLQQYQNQLLPSHHPLTVRIGQIVDRLIESLEYFGIRPEIHNWTVHVINAPIQNAFVLPSGKIFIFTGIVEVAHNPDGIATVLGHEIAHAVARHPAENMSIAQLIGFGLFLFKLVVLGDISDPLPNFLANLMIQLPFSRRVELEADRIGLMLMARACFNPYESVRFWQRMGTAGKQEGGVPSFLSTHPAGKKRIEKLKEWIPEAMSIRENSNCFSFFKWK